MTNTGAKWWAWCAAAGVLAADLGSKAWASQYVSDGPGSAALGGFVRLRRVSNHGASFGLGAQHPFVVTAPGRPRHRRRRLVADPDDDRR